MYSISIPALAITVSKEDRLCCWTEGCWTAIQMRKEYGMTTNNNEHDITNDDKHRNTSTGIKAAAAAAALTTIVMYAVMFVAIGLTTTTTITNVRYKRSQLIQHGSNNNNDTKLRYNRSQVIQHGGHSKPAAIGNIGSVKASDVPAARGCSAGIQSANLQIFTDESAPAVISWSWSGCRRHRQTPLPLCPCREHSCLPLVPSHTLSQASMRHAMWWPIS